TAEAAEVGDGKSPTLYFIGTKLPGTGACGEVGNGTLQADDVFLVRVANYRDDQAVLERHRDSDIDVAMIEDIGYFNLRVENGELADRRSRGAKNERQIGQAESVLGLEISFNLVAHLGDAGHVDFVDGRHVRRGALAEDHVLGDFLPHDAHGLNARR